MNSPGTETITFALGCFWGKEFLFQNTPGVLATRTGYTGGHLPHPTYEQVCSKTTGHAEAVEVTFDPAQIPFAKLLKIFFQNHNPTSKERQGENNTGNYRSAIFFHQEKQKTEALAFMEMLKAKGYDIVTQVAAMEVFYPAEARHQNYCQRTGHRPSPKSHPITF